MNTKRKWLDSGIENAKNNDAHSAHSALLVALGSINAMEMQIDMLKIAVEEACASIESGMIAGAMLTLKTALANVGPHIIDIAIRQAPEVEPPSDITPLQRDQGNGA